MSVSITLSVTALTAFSPSFFSLSLSHTHSYLPHTPTYHRHLTPPRHPSAAPSAQCLQTVSEDNSAIARSLWEDAALLPHVIAVLSAGLPMDGAALMVRAALCGLVVNVAAHDAHPAALLQVRLDPLALLSSLDVIPRGHPSSYRSTVAPSSWRPTSGLCSH